MITIPRFLSAGLTVITGLLRFRVLRARCCWEFRFLLGYLQIYGKLLATSSFVSSICFSRLAMPVYRCCGDSITGGGRNFMGLYILAVVDGFGGVWWTFWWVQYVRLYFNRSDFAYSLKL